jgi:PNKP adenylyltransferase domain, ligase domain/RNA repair, ligase-Pnkp-associating, region of Hen1/PNKP adenylyltransferase domain, C-terminal region
VYVDPHLAGTVRVADALSQLYVLMPVLDDSKHYWISPEEIDKLIRAGGDWLGQHPERELITRRYLGHHHQLLVSAVARLAKVDDTEPDALDNAVAGDPDARPTPLARLRTSTVLTVLRAEGASSVVDLGCGGGRGCRWRCCTRRRAMGRPSGTCLSGPNRGPPTPRRPVAAYRRYVWPTAGLNGIQLAPFQLLASAGRTWSGHDHGWHPSLADRLVQAAPALIRPTRCLTVDTGNDESVQAGIDWWLDLTATGAKGMVVKPFANLVKTNRGYAQPGIKVRGREYLRIIYGPDYTEPANLERLRERGLGHKRSLAAREYALGVESLERAVNREPLWRIHEPVFAVLAMESEPVDPRLRGQRNRRSCMDATSRASVCV